MAPFLISKDYPKKNHTVQSQLNIRLYVNHWALYKSCLQEVQALFYFFVNMWYHMRLLVWAAPTAFLKVYFFGTGLWKSRLCQRCGPSPSQGLGETTSMTRPAWLIAEMFITNVHQCFKCSTSCTMERGKKTAEVCCKILILFLECLLSKLHWKRPSYRHSAL